MIIRFLHSFLLSKLLTGMKDDDGKLTLLGFYDGIQIDAKTREILNAVPDDEKEIRSRLQLGSVDKVGNNYLKAIQYLSLNIPAVTVPTVNRDNNQHSPNENLRLGNYREGIKTMIVILNKKL